MPLTNGLKLISLYRFYPQAGFGALQRTPQLAAPRHDAVASHGNRPASFEFFLSPNPLRGDWGGTEGMGN